jgi:hypothetical protein
MEIIWPSPSDDVDVLKATVLAERAALRARGPEQPASRQWLRIRSVSILRRPWNFAELEDGVAIRQLDPREQLDQRTDRVCA